MTGDKPKKTWRIVLVVSLALNLLVVGAVVGSHYSKPDRNARSDWSDARAARSSDGGLGPFGRALSREDRRELGEKFRANREKNPSTRQQMRGLIAKVSEAVRADPFVPEDVVRLFDEQRAVAQQGLTNAQNILVEHLSQMAPDDRAAFADRLDTIMRGGKKKR